MKIKRDKAIVAHECLADLLSADLSDAVVSEVEVFEFRILLNDDRELERPLIREEVALEVEVREAIALERGSRDLRPALCVDPIVPQAQLHDTAALLQRRRRRQRPVVPDVVRVEEDVAQRDAPALTPEQHVAHVRGPEAPDLVLLQVQRLHRAVLPQRSPERLAPLGADVVPAQVQRPDPGPGAHKLSDPRSPGGPEVAPLEAQLVDGAVPTELGNDSVEVLRSELRTTNTEAGKMLGVPDGTKNLLEVLPVQPNGICKLTQMIIMVIMINANDNDDYNNNVDDDYNNNVDGDDDVVVVVDNDNDDVVVIVVVDNDYDDDIVVSIIVWGDVYLRLKRTSRMCLLEKREMMGSIVTSLMRKSLGNETMRRCLHLEAALRRDTKSLWVTFFLSSLVSKMYPSKLISAGVALLLESTRSMRLRSSLRPITVFSFRVTL